MVRYQADIPGRELIDWAPRKGERELIIVLYHLPDNVYTPYVTWTAHKDTPENTFWGHYFQTLEDAEADLEKRALGG